MTEQMKFQDLQGNEVRLEVMDVSLGESPEEELAVWLVAENKMGLRVAPLLGKAQVEQILKVLNART